MLPRPKRRRNLGRRTPQENDPASLLENDLIKRVSYEQYREKVRDVYGGPQGALLATASLLSLHIHLGDRLLRERKFDLRGAKTILDVGSGAGQIAKHLLKYADRDAAITCFDLSPEMLRRAANAAEERRCRTTWRPTCRGCRLPTAASTASPAAMCSSTCPRPGPAWPNWPA